MLETGSWPEELLIRAGQRMAVTITPAASPRNPPATAAGRPSSTTANTAVGAYTHKPITSPVIAPITPAVAAPATAHRAGKGKRRSDTVVVFTTPI
jgi:hypothetical protein